MQNYQDALNVLLNSIKPYEKVEKISLTQCLGRVLASDIRADENSPAYPTASMDGYAFAHGNLKLKLIGTLPAGKESGFEVRENECVKTFTGSLLSKGCDTLVPVENVKLEGDFVKIIKQVPKGFAVRPVGEGYNKGELMLEAGCVLGYSEIALLAQLGLFHISVFVRPVIGVLSSGSELLDLGEHSTNKASLRSSNHVALASLAKQIGCEARIFPLVKDDANIIRKSVLNAISSCDILITSGGVSMGDYDYLKQIIKEFDVLVDKVAIKPGRHVKIASCGEKYFFALPGFPYSAMVCFVLFVRELIYTQLKMKKDYELFGRLEDDYTKKSDLLEFAACNVSFKDANICINLAGKKQGSSAIISNLTHKSALMQAEQNLTKGDLVKLILMP